MRISTSLKVLVGIAVFLGIYAIWNINIFKSNAPSIEAFVYINPTTKMPLENDKSAWNPEKKIAIEVKHEHSIRSYIMRITTQDNVVVLDKEEIVLGKPKHLEIQLSKPNMNLPNQTRLRYEIIICDWSSSNFFRGKTFTKTLDLTINNKKPSINIIASSNKIRYGGSALLIFQVDSVDIKTMEISNGTQRFSAFPFLKDDYYAVILAWPINNINFNPTISITDSALNTQRTTISLVRDYSPRYKTSNIRLGNDFLGTKVDTLISDLKQRYPAHIKDSVEKFIYINERIRKEDESIINQKAKSLEPDIKTINKPKRWQAFIPLKGYAAVGAFGDKRTYIMPDGKKSYSTHLGLDMASVKNDNIISSNIGQVALVEQLGVYGKTLLIDHGFGLYSLYSHLEDINVKVGDMVLPQSVLGKTGQSGLALGDHLHFSMLVQGAFVRNAEWMDSSWIKNNITDVFEKARQIIQGDK